jgi:hypothetical protein
VGITAEDTTVNTKPEHQNRETLIKPIKTSHHFTNISSSTSQCTTQEPTKSNQAGIAGTGKNEANEPYSTHNGSTGKGAAASGRREYLAAKTELGQRSGAGERNELNKNIIQCTDGKTQNEV